MNEGPAGDRSRQISDRARIAPNLHDVCLQRNRLKTAEKVEMLFAHLKRILGLSRLRLRGPLRVKDEFTLAPTAQKPPETGKALPGKRALDADRPRKPRLGMEGIHRRGCAAPFKGDNRRRIFNPIGHEF